MDSVTGSDARCHHLQPLVQRRREVVGCLVEDFICIFFKTFLASNIGLYKCPGILCWNDLVDSYYSFCCIYCVIYNYNIYIASQELRSIRLAARVADYEWSAAFRNSVCGVDPSLGQVWCGCPQVDSLTLRIQSRHDLSRFCEVPIPSSCDRGT